MLLKVYCINYKFNNNQNESINRKNKKIKQSSLSCSRSRFVNVVFVSYIAVGWCFKKNFYKVKLSK